MSKLIKTIRLLWASPVTFIGLVYALTFHAFKWYKFVGVKDGALVWLLNRDRAPTFLMKYWKNRAGHACGNVIVLRNTIEQNPRTFKHELKHVDQVERLSVFQPIVYALSYLAIKFGCPGSNPYYSNPFEIDARRFAGQIIDIEGIDKKLHGDK